MEYAKKIYGIEFLPEPMTLYTPLGDIEVLRSGTETYQCGHCGMYVAGIVVAYNTDMNTLWLGCPNCKKGSVRDDPVPDGSMWDGRLMPPPPLGDTVNGLPPEVESAYLEARMSFSYGCYTACELMCRKILMNVAVQKGANKNKKFAEYVEYLKDQRHVSVEMDMAIEKIRYNGNEAAHEIKSPGKERAKYTLRFTMLLLKNVYETPELLNQTENDSSADP